jgi:RNA polymerase sigma factor (sigma-70 family)
MTPLVKDSGRLTPARLAGSAILACQSDERLVELVRDGHERAFEAIVTRYRKGLVRFSGRFLPESRTEDAVQQAFINAHAALLASDEPVQLKGWLFAITRNAALNMLRQNGWNYDEIPLDFDGVRRPDQIVEQRIELQNTVAAVNDLPERQRDALVMREFEGRSYQEIGTALGANDGAVRQLLNRARVTLRSAAALLMPPPLVARAASLPPADGRRVAEVLSGLGAAGMAKAGATALVAGSLVVGAVNAPLPTGASQKPARSKATLALDPAPTAKKATARTTPVVAHTNRIQSVRAAQPKRRAATRHTTVAPAAQHESHSGSGRAGTRNDDHSGSPETTRSHERDSSGSDDHTQSGSDNSRSGSGGSDDASHSGSDDTVVESETPSTTVVTTPTDSSGKGSGSDDASSSPGPSSSSGSDDPDPVTPQPVDDH